MKELWFYDLMAKSGRLNYRAKIMLTAFIGTHIPLIALVSYFAMESAKDWQTFFTIVGVTLAATLIGTGITLFVLNHLLRPVIMTSRTLRAYRQNCDTGSLPTHYTDEVGTLMADAGETIVHLEEALDTLEHIDGTTGLANRKKLVLDVKKRAASQQRFSACAIRFGTYDRIADTLDLKAAEWGAKQLAERLEAALCEDETLYRVGGAEFILLAPLDDDTGALNAAAERLKEILADCGKVITCQSLTLDPVLHGGIAAYPYDAEDADMVVDHALSAVALATESMQINFHSPAARQAAVERLKLDQELRRALSGNEFVLHYQPVIDLSLGKATGAEALIRWQHPEHGLLPPARFIAEAEASGLIDPIGLWVLREACMQVRDWNASGLTGMKVAVNLSARQFLDPNLIGFVSEALDESGIAADQLEIELTETAAMADQEFTRAVFAKLRDLGVSIAIDDFGTGYASMSYLRKLPFDKLKIDREFVTDVHKTRDSQAICGALVTLAQGLGLEALAEGAESEDEVRYLSSRGCEMFQGYHFSKPLPAAEFEGRIPEISLAAMAMRMRKPDAVPSTWGGRLAG